MDAPTISAIAAWAAAGVAATLAGVQFYVGRKQAEGALTSAKAALMNAQNSGRHTIAEFRQNWIDKVIDTLCEHHAILVTHDEDHPLSDADRRRLVALRIKLEILLNPDEADTVTLLKLTDEILESDHATDRNIKAREAVQVARRLLKTEWVRIKTELQ